MPVSSISLLGEHALSLLGPCFAFVLPSGRPQVHALYLYLMFCLFLIMALRGRGYGNRFNDFWQVSPAFKENSTGQGHKDLRLLLKI